MAQTLTDRGVVVAPAADRAANILLWVLQVAATGMFLMAGFSKLAGAPEMVVLFDAVGVGQWFRYVTGSMEVLGAVLLLVPRLSGVGALLLACVMVGATASHLFVIGGNPLMPLVLLAVTVAIALGRRGRTARLLGL
jgi:uncharacterized membrane protein YphA (DoxX/SURF4 family)